jgi:excinuclease ABC subunit A
MDEPSAGLHPADTVALLAALDGLKAGGNSLFIVEHELDVVRHADWIVDVGPAAGEQGGEVLYSGPIEGLRVIKTSETSRYLFGKKRPLRRVPREPTDQLVLKGIRRNNLKDLTVRFPLGVFTCVTGVSGSGKSTLVSQALAELVAAGLGQELLVEPEESHGLEADPIPLTSGRIVASLEKIRRLVRVDQTPIGRTPRSNLATYTGLFDSVRKLFVATPAARRRHYDAGQFSFNVAKGRCPHCEGRFRQRRVALSSERLCTMPNVPRNSL